MLLVLLTASFMLREPNITAPLLSDQTIVSLPIPMHLSGTELVPMAFWPIVTTC
jgi:hypothetical protein